MKKYFFFGSIIFCAFLFCNSFVSQSFPMEQNFEAQEEFAIKFQSACLFDDVIMLKKLLEDQNNLLALKNFNEAVYGFYNAIRYNFFNIVHVILENQDAFEQLKEGISFYSEAFGYFFSTACENGNVAVIEELLKKPSILDSLTKQDLNQAFNVAISKKQIAIAKLLAKSEYITAKLWPSLSGI